MCLLFQKYYQGSDLKNCDLFISFPVHFAENPSKNSKRKSCQKSSTLFFRGVINGKAAALPALPKFLDTLTLSHSGWQIMPNHWFCLT